MIENDEKISEYIDFPRTFEKYKWYKPILVLIVGLIIFLIFQVLLVLFFNAIYGWNFIMQIATGGYHSTSSTLELNDTIISVAFAIILLIIMYYVGKKTDWFGEIK